MLRIRCQNTVPAYIIADQSPCSRNSYETTWNVQTLVYCWTNIRAFGPAITGVCQLAKLLIYRCLHKYLVVHPSMEKIVTLSGEWITEAKWISLTTNIQLNQIINEPTRVTNTSETLIDHIYVSDDLPVLYSSPIKYSISDHFPVFAVFKMTNIDYSKNDRRHKIIAYRKYNNFNSATFLSDLQNAPWLTIGAENISIDQYLQSFISTVTKIIDKHLPLVTKRIKRPKQPEWITNNILLAINKRENAKKNKDEHNYKYWRNEVTKLIRDAKKEYYSESIQLYKNDPKKLSKVFNELSNKSNFSNNIKTITYENKTFTDDADIANTFNKYFTSVSEKYLNKKKKVYHQI